LYEILVKKCIEKIRYSEMRVLNHKIKGKKYSREKIFLSYAYSGDKIWQNIKPLITN